MAKNSVAVDAFDDLDSQSTAPTPLTPKQKKKPSLPREPIELHFKHCKRKGKPVTNIPCEFCQACKGNAHIGYTLPGDGTRPVSKHDQAVPKHPPKVTLPTPATDEDGTLAKVDGLHHGVPKFVRQYGPVDTIHHLDTDIVEVNGKPMTKRERAMALIKQGNFVEVAFRALGVPSPTFYRWCSKGREEEKAWMALPDDKREGRIVGIHHRLLLDIAEASAAAEIRYTSVIADGALGKKQIGTAMWRLERLNPQNRGGHVVVQEGGDKPVQHEHQVNANVNVRTLDVTKLLERRPELFDVLSELAEVVEVEDARASAGPPALPERVTPSGAERSALADRSDGVRHTPDQDGDG